MWGILIGASVGFVGYLGYYFIRQAIEKRKNKKVESTTDIE